MRVTRSARRLGGPGAIGLAAAAIGLGAVATSSAQPRAAAERLEVAKYEADGRLDLPTDIDRWIGVGAGVGGNYSETAFDPRSPGPITVVQMEPSAYNYFLRNKRYADGTMLLLSFYRPQAKPEPALQGFVQGDLAQREIHVIDRRRFATEGRAFFVFPPDAKSAASMPVGSVCVECHTAHGAYDGSFAQFYPALRASLPLTTSEPSSPGAAQPSAAQSP
jgi:hypothetical protein